MKHPVMLPKGSNISVISASLTLDSESKVSNWTYIEMTGDIEEKWRRGSEGTISSTGKRVERLFFDALFHSTRRRLPPKYVLFKLFLAVSALSLWSKWMTP
jgi:hypothetical protein